jgi:Flp pilus assembly pilin Flp
MIQSLTALGRRLHTDARGLTTVEYTIVLCLIAALCVGVWKTFGGEVKGYIESSGTELRNNLSVDTGGGG